MATVVRSVRADDAVWAELGRIAGRRGDSVNECAVEAFEEWIGRHGGEGSAGSGLAGPKPSLGRTVAIPSRRAGKTVVVEITNPGSDYISEPESSGAKVLRASDLLSPPEGRTMKPAPKRGLT